MRCRAPPHITLKWWRGELLGEGTYGRVYLALNAETGKIMAVKQVELASGMDVAHNARRRVVMRGLRSQIEAYKALDHQNVVSYLGVDETPKGVNMYVASSNPADPNS